jgi:hypothetical protein
MWKLRITYKKKSKKKVDQFKFETPTPPQVDENIPTQINYVFYTPGNNDFFTTG